MADGFQRSGAISGDLYRAIFEASLDAILVFDDEGRYVEVNESYCKILQLPREELIGRHFSEVVPADLLNAATQALGRLMSGLPDGSGTDLMRELSARHGLRGIALSGYGMEEDVRQSLEAGFARHLTKPVSLPQLQAALREVAGAGG